MANPPEPFEKYKDPNAVLDYTFNWAEWLAKMAPDDVIVESTFAVSDGLTEIDDWRDMSDTTTTVWLSGGTADQDYTVVNHIVTAQGREEDKTLKIYCREL